MKNPFGNLVGLEIDSVKDGSARGRIGIAQHHLNPHGIVHGAVPYALADTAMGAAVYSSLEPGQICATIEIKMNYFRAVTMPGLLECEARVIHRGRTTANVDADLIVGGRLVARANGTFAILAPRPAEA